MVFRKLGSSTSGVIKSGVKLINYKDFRKVSVSLGERYS